MNNHTGPALQQVQRMTSASYDSSQQHFIVLSLQYKWLSEVALPFASGVLLDYGCGGRPYQALFSTQITRYIGADIAASKDVQLDVELTPGERVPLPDASVDTILSTQTLEHVYDFQQYMSECHRLLRPGGILILSVPMQWRIHEIPHDYWRFTRYGLHDLMTKNQLEPISIMPCGGAWALAGQIVNSHLDVHRRGRAWLYKIINRIALWLDNKYPDADETLLWMCISRKPTHGTPSFEPSASSTITLQRTQ